MKKSRIITAWLLGFCCLGFLQAQDEEGCQDHTLVSRMPQFHITSCENRAFDGLELSLGFDTQKEETLTRTIEGKVTLLEYELNEETPMVSPLQLMRNYEQAFLKLGATLYREWDPDSSYNYLTAHIQKNGHSIWAMMRPSEGSYTLSIVEEEAMVQQVTATDLWDALNRDGFIALYIEFDTGKATLRDSAQGQLEQICALLQNQPDLKLSVEGHTDNTGTPEGNRLLSGQRARSVMKDLVDRGIDASRLAASGWGQERPIADNRTEEGRSKNRRVELVKR